VGLLVAARDIAVAMMRLGAESLRDHMLGDPVLTPRLGFGVARRGGLWCFSSRKLDAEVFNHVSGYGTFAEASQRAIDGMLRHYDRIGAVARVEMLVPFVSASDRRLLERNGFRDAKTIFQTHLRTSSRPPRTHDVRGLTIARAKPAEARAYSRLATRGFGGRHGVIGDVFERGWIRQLPRDRRAAAFIGRVNGTPGATGVILVRPHIAGLYSGSVLRRFRGRGIQNAMIAARVAHGWARGVRTFYSWSDPDNSSARNLRDEGFRTRYEVHLYERPA
jgi:ribosomal protein S18 acetylase RimI-like enzyme